MDRYSAANALLMYKQQPQATQLKDFRDWQEDGVKAVSYTHLFDDERVMLYDTQFPLFNKEMTRTEFDLSLIHI